MVEDLNIPVKVKVLSTVREEDGLALSSRNTYLNAKERKEAVVLFKALELARSLVSNGIRDARRIKSAVRRLINTKKSARIDYIEIVDPATLQPLNKVKKDSLITLVVFIGNTRLIDNYQLSR